jgi:hypothetical protein
MKIKLYTHPENRQYLKKKDNTEKLPKPKEKLKFTKKKENQVNNEYEEIKK